MARPGCVAFVIAVELAVLVMALKTWKPMPGESADLSFQTAD